MSVELMEKSYSMEDFRWSTLLLFGCFCVGYNVTIAFHELGHAFSMVLDRVHIKEFFLNPFSWSWTFPESLNNPVFTAFGGISFGLLFAVLPLLEPYGFEVFIFAYLYSLLLHSLFQLMEYTF